MKTLIVHPQDPTTTFLKGIYDDLPDKTVITGGVSKSELRKEISCHDRILILGHGSPNGLFSVGQFPNGLYVIDDSMVESLRHKTNFFIWCNADVFVRRHGLTTGFHTGMFLSEMSECMYFRVECSEADITESNYEFAEIFSRHINEPPIVFYKHILLTYGRLIQRNPVARYNHSRLFLNHFTPDLFVGKVIQTC